MKSLMILGGSILQLPAIIKASDMGIRVIVIDMDPNAIGFSVPGVVKEVISTIDTPKVLEAAIKHNIDGIMTLASDMPMQTVAIVCKKLGLSGISEETALKATNKAYMRDSLKESGVPIPLYYRVKTKEDFNNAVSDFNCKGLKCIVKPADNSGSRGVYYLSDSRDYEKAYNYAKSFSRSGELVVEEYMEGPEVSVETLTIDGVVHVVQITDKITTGAPYFVEMGHSQPSHFDSALKHKISEVAKAANKAIGINIGPSHTEIKITKEGPKIVELGARLGGDCISTHLVPLSTGVDLVTANIMLALGDIPDVSVKWNKGAAIKYMETNSGIVQSISGIELAENCSGVVQVTVLASVGDHIGEISSSNNRIGFVIAKGNDAKDAVIKATNSLNHIQITINNESM